MDFEWISVDFGGFCVDFGGFWLILVDFERMDFGGF